MGEILLETVAELRGSYPDIVLPEDIDREALGPDAMFVTLPIMPSGARGNGPGQRTYTEPIVQSIVRQINSTRPEGQWGHVPVSELDSRYNPPAVRCLAALMDDNKRAWGKFYVQTPEAREHFRVAKATNASVATSIFGDAVIRDGKFVDVVLHKIDIADPARAGIRGAVAVPHITAEMEASASVADDAEGGIVNEQIAEMTAERQRLETQVGALTTQIAEMQQDRDTVAELRGIFGAETDFLAHIKALATEHVAAKRETLKRGIADAVAEMVELEPLREYVAEMVEGAESVEAARAKIEQIQSGATYTTLAKALVVKEMGGPAVVPAKAADEDEREAFIQRAIEAGTAKANARRTA